ncbi:MAG: hypothetical protein JRJ87_24650 [Deltaproteobacteria bacterium]|nr:hypothetical protein [Deltaproteobacteria bacterium]
MKRWVIPTILLAVLIFPAPGRSAEITDVLDAADGNDPIDVNIDIHFRSILDRSKITHEDASYWSQPDYLHRPDFNELRYQQQIYAMDYMVQIGLYHDVELYVNLPWIISDTKKINFVSGVTNSSSTMFRATPGATWAGNLVASDPTTSPETKRSGIGDMQVGVKWAIFNEERDDTKSVWLFGLDYKIPSGKLNRPQDIVDGSTGGVGLGHHILTPFMLFSHRYKILDPYVGIHGSLPIQGREAQNAGLTLPYYGGFLVGMEIVPWENKDKFQKFSIDLRLTTDFYAEVDVKGNPKKRGTVNEMSDFLAPVPSSK